MCRPSQPTQDASLPAPYRPFLPYPNPFYGPLEAPADRTSHSPRIRGPPVPASPALWVSGSLLEKWRRESCPIDHSERTFTAHAQRAPRRALCYRLVHSLAGLAILLTGGRVRGFHSPLPTLSYAITQTPRSFYLPDKCRAWRTRGELQQPRVCQAVGSTASGTLRSKCACAGLISLDLTRGVGCEPMKMQRLSSPGQSAFGVESLTPI